MMKFALFLVVALVAVQGFQARSVEEPTDRAISDVIDAIKAAIQKIKDIISNITSQIPELIQNIKDKIKEIVGNISGLIESIKQKIEDLIHLAGEVGRKCLESHRDQIDALVKFAQDGVQGCVAEAESKTEALREQINVLVGKAEALRDDVINRAVKCAEDNKLNPIKLLQCLKDQVEPVKNEIAEIQKEVVNTISVAKEVAQEAGSALVECASKVQQEVADKEVALLNSIKDCIANSA